jgi:heme exporter protein C
MLLRTSIDDMRRADRSSAVFSLVGVVNVPIIYYSVQWWNTLHQGASVSMSTGSKMAATMLMAMLIMTIAFWLYSIAVILARVRCIVVERDSLPVWDEKPAVSQEVVEVR